MIQRDNTSVRVRNPHGRIVDMPAWLWQDTFCRRKGFTIVSDVAARPPLAVESAAPPVQPTTTAAEAPEPVGRPAPEPAPAPAIPAPPTPPTTVIGPRRGVDRRVPVPDRPGGAHWNEWVGRYAGRPGLVLASGPTRNALSDEALERFRSMGGVVMGVNREIVSTFARHLDAWTALDASEWQREREAIEAFAGTLLVQRSYNLQSVLKTFTNRDAIVEYIKTDDFLVDVDHGRVFHGSNSACAAIQLLWAAGCSDVFTAGVDLNFCPDGRTYADGHQDRYQRAGREREFERMRPGLLVLADWARRTGRGLWKISPDGFDGFTQRDLPGSGLASPDGHLIYDPTKLPAEPVVVQVGAFRWHVARYVLDRHPEAKMFVVEADPEHVRKLEESKDRIKSVKILKAALAGKQGMVRLNRYGGGEGNSLVPVHEHAEGSTVWGDPSKMLRGTVATYGRSLGNILDKLGVDHCDLLLLNCEGGERYALEQLASDAGLRSRVGQISTGLHVDHWPCYDAATAEAMIEAVRPWYDITKGSSKYDYRLLIPKQGRSWTVASFATHGIYLEQLDGLKASCEQLGVSIVAEHVADPGDWQKANKLKPSFIKRMLDQQPGRAVLWVDADGRVRRDPAAVDDLVAAGVDVAAHWRVWSQRNPNCEKGPELLGGTLYFANTAKAREVLDAWQAACDATAHLNGDAKQKAKWARDQECLARAVVSVPGVRIGVLPASYCQISGCMGDDSEAVVLHGLASCGKVLREEPGS